MFPAPFSYGGSFAYCDSLHLLNTHRLTVTAVGGKWFLMKYYVNYELRYYALCVSRGRWFSSRFCLDRLVMLLDLCSACANLFRKNLQQRPDQQLNWSAVSPMPFRAVVGLISCPISA